MQTISLAKVTPWNVTRFFRVRLFVVVICNPCRFAVGPRGLSRSSRRVEYRQTSAPVNPRWTESRKIPKKTPPRGCAGRHRRAGGRAGLRVGVAVRIGAADVGAAPATVGGVVDALLFAACHVAFATARSVAVNLYQNRQAPTPAELQHRRHRRGVSVATDTHGSGHTDRGRDVRNAVAGVGAQ